MLSTNTFENMHLCFEHYLCITIIFSGFGKAVKTAIYFGNSEGVFGTIM